MTTEELIRALERQADVFNVRDIALYPGPSQHMLRLAASRLRELHDATRRRPIKEAPKDGTYVLLFDKESMVIPIIGSWEPRSTGRGKTWHDVSLNDIGEEHGFIPTHFMPLPEGPK